MIRRPLLLQVFALLLFLAGPASASHPPMMMDTPTPEPCHEMGGAATHAMAHAHSAAPEAQPQPKTQPDHDCESRCACCPGSCSGFVALTAQPDTLALSSSDYLRTANTAAPARTPLELLRPPKIA